MATKGRDKNMKKAVIITYYEAPNYGAFLQAYSTQRFLRKNGVESFILKHKANKPYLISKLIDMRANKDVISFRNQIQEVINGQLHKLHITSGKDKYSLAVIGSDEVWNIKNLTAIHLPIFFNPYRKAEKTISYAACAGKCKLKHIKLFPFAKGIKKLDKIAVRDNATAKLIKDYINIEPVRTLDPTFLCDFDDDLPPRMIDEPYLLVYTYGLSENTIVEIKNLARQKKLSIIATGSKCDWADKNLVPNPFEWLSLIKHSEAVITSTFHGTVFSIIFRKQFITVETHSDKVCSLLDELSLKDRLTKNSDIALLFSDAIDYSKLEAIIRGRCDESKKFILDQLQ